MDEVKVQEIVNMWNSAMDMTAIAEELEISPTSVRNALINAGIDTTIKPPTAMELAVGTMYVTGVPIPEILEKHSITYTRLYAILAKQGVELRKVAKNQGAAFRMEQAIQMYQDGAPLWQIKKETGVAQPSLHAELHTRLVPLRRPRGAKPSESEQ